MERVAVGPVLAAIMLEHGASARGAGMRPTMVNTDLAVIADARLLTRILGNLVANAVRHARGERILLGVRRHGERVRLWVIDDGDGIAEADVARLFDDYVQGSDHGTENRGGFGLGLASARRMAHLMNGEIGLDRRWTGGSAFYIDLAAADPRAAAKVADIKCKAA